MGIKCERGAGKFSSLLIIMGVLFSGLLILRFIQGPGFSGRNRMSRIKNQLLEKSRENEKLCFELEKSRFDTSSLKEAILNLEQSISQSRDVKALNNLRQEKKTLEGRLASLSQELRNASVKLNKAIRESASLKQDFDRIDAHAKKDAEELSFQFKEKAGQLKKLITEKSEIERQLNTITGQFNEKDRLCVSLKQELDKARAEYREKKAEAEMLKQQKDELENSRNQAQSEGAALRNQIDSFESQVKDLKQQAADYSLKIKGITEQGEKSRQDYDAIAARFDELLLKNASLEKEIASLKQQLSIQEGDTKKHQESLSYLEQEISRLNIEKGSLEAERNLLKENLDNANKAANFLNSQFFQSRQALDEKTAQLSKVGEELNSLKSERESLNQQLASSLQNQKDINVQFSQAMDSVLALQNKLKDVSGLLDKGAPEKSGLKPKVEVTLFPAGQEGTVEKRGKENTATLHYNLGLRHTQREEYREAVKEFKLAIELNPLDADSCYNLAVIYDDNLNSKKEASQYYQKYLKLRPDAEDAQTVREWLRKAKE